MLCLRSLLPDGKDDDDPPHAIAPFSRAGRRGRHGAWQVPERQRPQPEPIAQMVQEGVNLVFVIKVPGAAAVVESNTLLPPPPPPTGPLQQHGHDM